MSDPMQHPKRIIDISMRTMNEIDGWLKGGLERDADGTRLFLRTLRSRADMCRFDAVNIMAELSLRDLQAEAKAANEAFRTTDGE